MSQRVLVVEGVRDREFFEAACREIQLTGVDVKCPCEMGLGGNGWGNAMSLMGDLQEQMPDGNVARLGVVVDADYASFGRGYRLVRDAFREQLRKLNYSPNAKTVGSGLVLDLMDFLWVTGAEARA